MVWIVAAVYGARRGPRRTSDDPGWAFAVSAVIVGAIFLAIFDAVPAHGWRSLEVHSALVTGIGLVILLPSTVLTVWARLALGTMWSMDAEVREGHELRTDGPYGITRHPIYTGMLGMLLGSVLVAGVGRWVLLLPIGLVLLAVKIRLEENLLLTTFPDAYPRYRQQVPQLIPGIRVRRNRSRRA